ncbi:MAG: serine/threonine protein kinase [Burkholderiales bacterium]|nr:serine/threonine protein kinase [Burkholderiales bacterium]
MNTSHPYDALTPDCILQAMDSIGLAASGSLLALNSYENRVYQVGIDDATPVVAKFYRPQRWSDAQILEDHAFALELAEHEIPIVAPLLVDGRSLFEHDGFRFAVFPRRGGRSPELDRPDVLEWIGRFLGRIHAVGGVAGYAARPAIDIATFGEEPSHWLQASGTIALEWQGPYREAVNEALDCIRSCFERAGSPRQLRLHGDCHAGNILWTDAGPHFVDLDDSRMGPAVQDIWMLLSGDRSERARQLGDVLAGYEDFCEFDMRELYLIEALRTLRLIHYSAWLARRWDDPAFPAAFTWFGTPQYWADHVAELREQVHVMGERALD